MKTGLRLLTLSRDFCLDRMRSLLNCMNIFSWFERYLQIVRIDNSYISTFKLYYLGLKERQRQKVEVDNRRGKRLSQDL